MLGSSRVVQLGRQVSSSGTMAQAVAPAIPTQPAVIAPTNPTLTFPVTNDNAPHPSWLTTIRAARYHNVFYTGEALTLTMESSGATAWKATDIDGNTSTGSINSNSQTFTVTKPAQTPANAWLEVIVTGPQSDPNYGNVYGQTCIHIWNNTPNIPQAPGVDESWAGPGDQSWASIEDALTNFGPQRFYVSDPGSTTATTSAVNYILGVMDYDAQWWGGHGSVNRPRENFCSFTTSTSTTAQQAGVTSAVQRLYPTIKWFEGPNNEPQDNNVNTVISQMVTFANAVRAGNPNAKVIGPSCVTFNASQTGWLTAFLNGLPPGTIDGLSIHGYNTSNGDLAMTDAALANLRSVLNATGYSNLPVFMTEGCGEFINVYGVVHWRRSAHWIGMRYLLYEAYGIPRERQSFFFPYSVGFWEFPAFMWSADDNADAPILDFLRGLQERTYNSTFTRRLDFGSVGQLLFFGSVYTSPTDQCVVLMCGGSPSGTVKLHIGTGQTATVYDWIGNSQTQSADGAGNITVAVNDLATYVSCSLTADISVVDADEGLLSAGANLAMNATFSASTAAASTSYNYNTPVSINTIKNGQFEYGFYFYSANGIHSPVQWESTGPPPVWVMGKWTDVQTVGRIVIATAPPWQQQCGLLTFTLATWDGSAWVTQYSFNDTQATSFPFVRPEYSWGSVRATYWKEQCAWDITLPAPVQTNGVLLTVTKTSYGGEPDLASGNMNGIGQGGPTIVGLREFMVFSG